jgi:hypothetical protein
MPAFNSHSLDPTWKDPEAADIQQFFDTLVEKPVREEKNLIRNTTEAEIAFIASRVEEAELAEEAGEFGRSVGSSEESDGEGLAGEEELAGQS